MPRAVPIVVALLALQAALVLLFVVARAGSGAARAAGRRRRARRGAAARAATRSTSTATPTRTPPATAIREREVYGAVVPAEGRVLVASAASPVGARQQLDGGLRAGRGDAQGGGRRAARVRRPARRRAEPAVPAADDRLLPARDPARADAARRARGCSAPSLGFSALSGLALTALLRAMDALPGPYLAVSGVAALVVAAVALTAAGPGPRCSGRPASGSPRCCSSCSATRARATRPPRSCCPASGASPASCSRPARAARRCATSPTSTATPCSRRRSCSPPGRSSAPR